LKQIDGVFALSGADFPVYVNSRKTFLKWDSR